MGQSRGEAVLGRYASEAMKENDTDPLILTLRFDEDTQEFFERQRQAHFPPERNLIPAHLTLFHALPGDQAERVLLAARAAAECPAFPVRVTGLIFLGRGVAYRVEAEPLKGVRDAVAARFVDELTRQDAQGFRPHVTVQNKVTPARAKETLARLEAAFTPFEGWAEGLDLWRYRGGPWERFASVGFEKEAIEEDPGSGPG